ncbi:MAG: ester cyclase [Caldilineaceae bacterium]
MSQLTKKTVEHLTTLYLNVANSHDANRFGEIMAENYICYSRLGTIEGLASYKQVMMGFYTAFPNMQFFLDATVADGDTIVYHYHWTGTHQQELMGIPATGKAVTVYGMEMNRVENGKIVECWNYADQMSLMQQLGVIP